MKNVQSNFRYFVDKLTGMPKDTVCAFGQQIQGIIGELKTVPGFPQREAEKQKNNYELAMKKIDTLGEVMNRIVENSNKSKQGEFRTIEHELQNSCNLAMQEIITKHKEKMEKIAVNKKFLQVKAENLEKKLENEHKLAMVEVEFSHHETIEKLKLELEALRLETSYFSDKNYFQNYILYFNIIKEISVKCIDKEYSLKLATISARSSLMKSEQVHDTIRTFIQSPYPGSITYTDDCGTIKVDKLPFVTTGYYQPYASLCTASNKKI